MSFLIPLTIIFSILAPFIYILFWKKIIKNKKVPKGYGLIILLYILFSFFIMNNIEINFFQVALLVTIIIGYWFDDLIHLSIEARILLMICASVLVLVMIGDSLYKLLFTFIILFIFTNSINFSDGEDLNLSIILISYLLFMLYFNNFESLHIINNEFLILILITILGFSLFNYFPKKIYFGDAGCFGLGVIITSLIMYSYLNEKREIFIYLLPCFFLLIDFFYVIFVRINKGEKLSRRNYLHLYQVIKRKFNNKFYLIPYPLYVLFIGLFINYTINIGYSKLFIYWIVFVFSFGYYFSLRALNAIIK